MEITVKDAAASAFKKVDLTAEEGIRIEAVFVGSCSLYVDHNLWIEQKTDTDEVYFVDSIPFLIDIKSKQHLPDKLIVDYNPTLGFKLSSPEENYKYNLALKRR